MHKSECQAARYSRCNVWFWMCSFSYSFVSGHAMPIVMLLRMKCKAWATRQHMLWLAVQQHDDVACAGVISDHYA